MNTVLRDLDDLHAWRRQLTGSLALVPTMGHLHAGHLSLLRLAQEHADHVLASIYVNPLQFGAGEDFDRYPRSLDADLAQLTEAGCTAVFVPDDRILYPQGSAAITQVVPPANLCEILCGVQRPGHFTGVATVVLKLLQLTQPDLLLLGEKDYQQYLIVQQMLADFHLPTRLLCGPTQRAADGLALSSRNSLLSTAERALAPRLAAELDRLCQLPAGSDAGFAAAAARENLEAAGFLVDYLELRDSETLQPLSRTQPGGRWFIAARLGQVRLIDNKVIV